MGTPSLDLYLDDSGTRNPDGKASTWNRRDKMDHFALGGLLIKSELLSQIIDAYDEFCRDHHINYPLHSNSIRVKKGDFVWLESDIDRASKFYRALGEFLCNLPGHVAACVVHRPGYDERYRDLYQQNRWELCKSAYTIVVERAVKIALAHGRKLVVYVEASGKHEDRMIKEYHKHMLQSGMYFDAARSKKYTPLNGSAFSSALMKNPIFVRKENKPAQIADLLLYPVVKGRYDPTYPPYRRLVESGMLADSLVAEADRPQLGIKYYCFDNL